MSRDDPYRVAEDQHFFGEGNTYRCHIPGPRFRTKAHKKLAELGAEFHEIRSGPGLFNKGYWYIYTDLDTMRELVGSGATSAYLVQ